MKNKWIFIFVFLGVIGTIRLISAKDEEQQLVGDKREYSLLPKDKEGIFPIHMPEYDGVDQLIVLSSKWVIVLVNNSEEVVKYVDEKTKGEYSRLFKLWEASGKTGSLWKEKQQIDAIQKKYYAQGRIDVGEFKLDEINFYNISSNDDPDYDERLKPSRMTRYLTSLANQIVFGEVDVHWDHYIYIEMPKPMKNGKTYTIEVGDKRKVTFVYDEKKTVSRAIKVNQVGYLPGSKGNKAFLGVFLREFGPHDFSWVKEFSVVDVKNGDVVYTGPIKFRAHNDYVIDNSPLEAPADRRYLYGEELYEMDLSPVTKEGNYFITIAGVGRSWPFKIGNDALAESYYIATRGLYHQRCGIQIKEPYTAWPRIKCHTDTVYECDTLSFVPGMGEPNGYSDFEIIASTINYEKPHEGVVGGWHDAADWDKRLPHYANIYDLLYVYENAPRKFVDGQLNIPESGNGIPDILDEAAYGLLIWKNTMDKDGGTSSMVETWGHATINDPEMPYAMSRKTRWNSLFYAAAAAQYAELIKPFDDTKSKEYLASAMKAYEYGMNPKNSLGTITIKAAKNGGKGEPYTLTFTENEEAEIPYRIHAKLRLFLATGDQEYLKDIEELFSKTMPPMVWPFNSFDFSSWLYWSIFDQRFNGLIKETTREKWRKHYLTIADKLVKLSEESPYYHSWPKNQDYWMGWGASTMTNHARNLMMGYLLTKDNKYRDAAINNINFMYGGNPMGMSWTTGIGYTYPIFIQHAVSLDDGILDPVPGIAIYGINGANISEDLSNPMWRMKDESGKLIQFMKEANTKTPIWRRWWAHPYFTPPQNEFTVFETMSTSPVCLGLLLPDGWKPSEELKNRKPRKDELLFGFWNLP